MSDAEDHWDGPAVSVQALISSAAEARDRAYCPYSGFAVGAAILAASGRIYTGCNIENASYSVTTCAERVALQSAVCAGEREFVAIVILAGGDHAPRPCGSCLQALEEFSPGIRLLLASVDGRVEERVLPDLLPEPFRLRGAGGRA